MQTADFNHNDFGQTNAADEQLLVKFYYKTRQKRGQAAGEIPEFEEVEYIEIRVAGQRDAQVARPANEADKQRFPRHYEAFKQRVTPPEEGYPLSEWASISRGMVEQLSFLHVKTIEQLANISDTNITNIQGGATFKRKAEEWLLERNSTKTLADENKELRAQIEALTAKVESMFASDTGSSGGDNDSPAETVKRARARRR